MFVYKNSGQPIYQQICNDFEEKIFKGEIQGGEYLPSIRGLARDLKISVITTNRAYDELAKKGLINSIPGKGYVVVPQNGDIIREQQIRKIEDLLQQAIEAAEFAGISDKELQKMVCILLGEKE